MNVEFDSLRPAGDHGDEVSPRLTLTCKEPGIIQAQIRGPKHDDSSPIVDLDVEALVAALVAMAKHDLTLFREDAKFQRDHRPSCAECSGFKR